MMRIKDVATVPVQISAVPAGLVVCFASVTPVTSAGHIARKGDPVSEIRVELWTEPLLALALMVYHYRLEDDEDSDPLRTDPVLNEVHPVTTDPNSLSCVSTVLGADSDHEGRHVLGVMRDGDSMQAQYWWGSASCQIEQLRRVLEKRVSP